MTIRFPGKSPPRCFSDFERMRGGVVGRERPKEMMIDPKFTLSREAARRAFWLVNLRGA